MTTAPQRLTTKPTYLTTQLALHARRLVTEAFESVDARGYHYRVLAAVEELGPTSQADLGRSVSMDRSDVVAAVDQLAEIGQVERRTDPTDRRRRIIHLTAAGRRQLRRLDRALADAQTQFLAPLTAAEQTTLDGLLTTLLRYHEQAEPD